MEDEHDAPKDMRQHEQHSFLIRFWRPAPNGPWHVTLQRTTREQAMHFAGIDLLFAFLLTQLGEEAQLQHHTRAGEGVEAPADHTSDVTPRTT